MQPHSAIARQIPDIYVIAAQAIATKDAVRAKTGFYTCQTCARQDACAGPTMITTWT